MPRSRIQRLLFSRKWRWLSQGERAIGQHLVALARAEQCSFLTLRLAAHHTPSTPRSALYLRLAESETLHARLLQSRGDELLGRPSSLRARADDVFAAQGELGFVAYLHHTGRQRREQFELISSEMVRQGRTEVTELVGQIARDKLRLEQDSLALLLDLAGSKAITERQLLRMRRAEAGRAVRRSGHALVKGLSALCILVLFPLLWVASALLKRSIKPRHGFVAP